MEETLEREKDIHCGKRTPQRKVTRGDFFLPGYELQCILVYGLEIAMPAKPCSRTRERLDFRPVPKLKDVSPDAWALWPRVLQIGSAQVQNGGKLGIKKAFVNSNRLAIGETR